MMSRIWELIRGKTARREDTDEEKQITVKIVDGILALERKAALLAILTKREETMQRAMEQLRATENERSK